ncbi:MAG: glycine-rich domain-containing protein [Patescibacteria group bacterium]
MKKTLSLTLIILGFLLGASALSAVAAWTAPGCAPTGCNTDAPINASSSPQTKYGPLTLNFSNIYAIGLKVLGSVQIVDGTQGAGKVLTSDASGIASWEYVSSASSAAASAVSFSASGSGTVPANARFARITVVGGGGGGYSSCNTGNGCVPTIYTGGDGGLAIKTIPVTPGAAVTVTVGAGGATGGGSLPPGYMTPGGTTSVAITGQATVSASGGQGGSGATPGPNGADGSSTTGDFNAAGPHYGYGTGGVGSGSPGRPGVAFIEYF